VADYRSLELLHVTVAEGVATVVIDHPPVNLFDAAQMREFAQLARMLEADDDVRVVVFRSANPDFFIAHADVGGILDIPADQPPATKLGGFSGMVDRFRTMPKATIAVIEGRVGGGGSEFALSCDMRFAALGQAVFNQPEVGLGILPGGTGTQRLARLAGRSRAMEIILGSDDFDAATAERYGWVNRALPPAELWPFVDRLARRIASFPPEAVAESKALVNLADGAIVDGIVAEQNGFNRLHPLPHVRARMERFLAQGGQTPAGELRLGELVTEIG
jgi:enoyl-CoA hydratase/carnithine racemase